MDNEIQTFLLFLIAFSVGVGAFANSKNRSFLAWMILSFLFSPLAMFIVLLVVGKAPDESTGK